MKKLTTLLVAVVMVLGMFSVVKAAPVTLISQEDTWDYTVLSPDLWGGGIACWTCPGTWDSVGYDYVNWDSLTYTNVNAAFGNPYTSGLPFQTYWQADTDLALRKVISIDGAINGFLTLNVAADNGFAIFVNSQQVAKEYAGGYTSYWEYSFSVNSSFFTQGLNTIDVLAADHGGATFFDMELTADITPVPEASTIFLLGSGLMGLGFVRRKLMKAGKTG